MGPCGAYRGQNKDGAGQLCGAFFRIGGCLFRPFNRRGTVYPRALAENGFEKCVKSTPLCEKNSKKDIENEEISVDIVFFLCYNRSECKFYTIMLEECYQSTLANSKGKG